MKIEKPETIGICKVYVPRYKESLLSDDVCYIFCLPLEAGYFTYMSRSFSDFLNYDIWEAAELDDTRVLADDFRDFIIRHQLPCYSSHYKLPEVLETRSILRGLGHEIPIPKDGCVEPLAYFVGLFECYLQKNSHTIKPPIKLLLDEK